MYMVVFEWNHEEKEEFVKWSWRREGVSGGANHCILYLVSEVMFWWTSFIFHEYFWEFGFMNHELQ